MNAFTLHLGDEMAKQFGIVRCCATQFTLAGPQSRARFFLVGSKHTCSLVRGFPSRHLACASLFCVYCDLHLPCPKDL